MGQFHSAQLSFSDFYSKKTLFEETEMSYSFWCWLYKFYITDIPTISLHSLIHLFFLKKSSSKESSFLQFNSLFGPSPTHKGWRFVQFSFGFLFIVQEWLDNMLQSSLEPNSFTFGAFLRGCEKLRDVEAAHAVLRKMQDVDVAPNRVLETRTKSAD